MRREVEMSADARFERLSGLSNGRPCNLFEPNCVPAHTNPLGVKGVGESGRTAACPAVRNAIVDALAPLGVAYVDMTATPERLRAACTPARDATCPSPSPAPPRPRATGAGRD